MAERFKKKDETANLRGVLKTEEEIGSTRRLMIYATDGEILRLCKIQDTIDDPTHKPPETE